MRPLARQKIYKFYPVKNLIDFITFGILNFDKLKELENYLRKFFNTQKILCVNRGRTGAYLAVKASITDQKKKLFYLLLQYLMLSIW